MWYLGRVCHQQAGSCRGLGGVGFTSSVDETMRIMDLILLVCPPDSLFTPHQGISKEGAPFLPLLEQAKRSTEYQEVVSSLCLEAFKKAGDLGVGEAAERTPVIRPLQWVG